MRSLEEVTAEILTLEQETEGLLKRLVSFEEVEWLGEIPSHWELQPGRAYLKPQKVKNTGNKVSTVLSLS